MKKHKKNDDSIGNGRLIQIVNPYATDQKIGTLSYETTGDKFQDTNGVRSSLNTTDHDTIICGNDEMSRLKTITISCQPLMFALFEIIKMNHSQFKETIYYNARLFATYELYW